MNECPSCKTVVADDAKECPKCGVYFVKWKEREENLHAGNLTRYQQVAAATSSEFNWTILILVCLTVLGVLYFLGKSANLE